jgi:hypothetical protein
MSTGSVRIALLLLCLFIGFETEAKAYTDPGTGALIWQIVAASFMGAMFYFRKIRTFFIGLRRKQKNEDLP